MAQSLKSPVGVPLYWESGANPPQEWPSWLSTFKLAIMAKENLHVEQILRLKPTTADRFYPTVPSYEEIIEGANDKESRKRQIRNERRRVDWENECRINRNRGPPGMKQISRLKALCNCHSDQKHAESIINETPIHSLKDVLQTSSSRKLGLTFTRPRNITFDRCQLITVQQNSNENLDTFFRRLRELGSTAALGNVEEELIKEFFIAKMNNTALKM